MTAVDDRIIAFAAQLKDRYDPGLLDYAVSFVTAGEPAVAVETLVSWVCDNEIPISQGELENILQLQVDCAVPPLPPLVEMLRRLARHGP